MGKCVSKESEVLTKKRSLTKESEAEEKSPEFHENVDADSLRMKRSDKKLVKDSLRNHYLFKQLKKQDLYLIYQRMKRSELQTNEIIYDQDSIGSKFYIIRNGYVNLFQDNMSIKKLSKGETFGEMALITVSQRKESAQALMKTTLFSLGRGSFKKVLKQIFSKHFDSNREFISKVKFFSNAADSQKDTLTRLAVLHEYKEKDIIVKEGDDGYLMFIILKGRIAFFSGKSEICSKEAGDVFGEASILTGSKRRTTAISAENSKLLSLDKATLINVFGENFREMIFRNIAKYSILHDKYLEFLSKEHIITLVESVEWNQYPAGDVVIPEGYDKKSRFLIVCSGELISKKSDHVIGAYQVVGLQNPNERSMLDEAYKAGPDTIIGEICSSNIETLLNLQIDSIFKEAESIKLLKNISIFKYLTLGKLRLLTSKMIIEEFEKKEIIFNSKDPADSLYIIKEGSVNIYNEGKLYRTLGKFDIFGERCINEPIRSASARAIKRTSCWVLAEEDLRNIVDESIYLELERKKYYQADILLNNLIYVQPIDEKSERKLYVTYYLKEKAYYNVQVISKSSYFTMDQCISLVNEKNINLQLDYYLIIKLVKTFNDCDHVYFVTEHINGVSLREYMKSHLREGVVRFFISCIVMILEYLHDKNIIYRDMCPDNIIINELGYPHLYNFSSSKIVKGRTYTNIGNPFYKSPEIVAGRGYSKSTDFWSLGVLMHELLYESLPFGIHYSDDPVVVYEKIMNNKMIIADAHSYVLANELLEKLLVRDAIRAQGEDIRKSSWMKSVDWERLLRPSNISFVGPKIPVLRKKSLKENNQITIERYVYEASKNKHREKRNSIPFAFRWDKYF